ncbi:MAG: Crp/Fnr family transcriptional regulator [Clostridia bacterium]|nr:Crp/Fnr family transcriptional regulator [Clostridia bacterium]
MEKSLQHYFQEAGTAYRYRPDETIFMQEDEASLIYYIAEGRVRVFSVTEDGDEITFEVLHTGRIFGESSFFYGKKRPVTIKSINDVVLYACRQDRLFPYFSEAPELAIEIIKSLSASNDHMALLLKQAYLYDRYQTVASFLLDMDRQYSGHLDAENRMPFTHEQIAESTGLARVTVSRVLKEFQKQGLIELGYGKIRVLNHEGLKNKIRSDKA